MPFNQTGRISRAIVAVAGKSFRLADYFSGLLRRNDGQVVTRTMLLERVWDFHFDPKTSVVESQPTDRSSSSQDAEFRITVNKCAMRRSDPR
jgi:hypothetical protein